MKSEKRKRDEGGSKKAPLSEKKNVIKALERKLKRGTALPKCRWAGRKKATRKIKGGEFQILVKCSLNNSSRILSHLVTLPSLGLHSGTKAEPGL